MCVPARFNLLRLICWTLCTSVVAGCSGLSSPGHGYDEHLATWTKAGVTSYTFTFHIGGQSGPHAGRVTVQNGHVDGVVPMKTSSSAQPIEPLSYEPTRPSIDDVWALLRRDLKTADRVEVSYDDVFGFPSQVRVDRDKNAIDDEYGYGITDFATL
jgi:hypothetical protein